MSLTNAFGIGIRHLPLGGHDGIAIEFCDAAQFCDAASNPSVTTGNTLDVSNGMEIRTNG